MSQFHHSMESAMQVPIAIAFALRDYSLASNAMLCICRANDGYVAQELAALLPSPEPAKQ